MPNKDRSVQDTVVAQGMQIKGNLHSLANLYFDGTIIGNINCENDVVLGPNAHVEGHITCQNLEIDGQVIGNVEVTTGLLAHTGAVIKGDIKTQTLVVEEGAILRGSLLMPEPTPPATEPEQPETH